MDILKLAKENGYFYDAIDTLKNVLCETDKGWFYERSDYSGRDFYEPIPLEYLTETEFDHLFELITEEDINIEDYDWKNFIIDDVLDEIEENMLYEMFDYLNN